MQHHVHLTHAEVRSSIKAKRFTLAGNKSLKIYGRLNCKSGKRMKLENRVFFASAKEAESYGYRPCGHCQTDMYNEWKHESF